MYHGDGKLVDSTGKTSECEFYDGYQRHIPCVIAFGAGKFTKSIISRNKNGVIKYRNAGCFDFVDARTLMVGDTLVSFKGGDYVQVHHYKGVMDIESVTAETM